ncbi:hypothetical protein SNOG_02680 [Parastagonospora nodorum SN15]|uniref:Uncharacterized protein n=1 Tax=Phaeosphaeria nodorum (strain SN15 / ATCC MYA-4574 / FGSC 10173) TaxID=321614 RepID=Q0UZY4_PHANO|nr:hypothetical protein SNOG_02680 [Parastagonospora nodorum SN15]EAT89411.1 hypothetical protein SNOG_02680 [Parastagonospora nodorum SN15]
MHNNIPYNTAPTTKAAALRRPEICKNILVQATTSMSIGQCPQVYMVL